MRSVPATTKALVIKAKGQATIQDVSTPKLRDGYVLVRTTAVALNPTDWKHIDFMLGGDPVGARVGCDVAGVVVAVGPGVDNFKLGDRIAAGVHGSNQSQHEEGAFAEYVVAKAAIAFKIPEGMKDEDAATIPLGLTTVAQGLYQHLKLKLPTEPLAEPEPVFIYGGATATGILGIQLAKLSGYRVLTVAGPDNLDYVRSLGADFAVDYHNAPAAIVALQTAVREGGKPLRYAWDCISYPETSRFCAQVLSGAGLKVKQLHYASLLPLPGDALTLVDPRIQNGTTLYYTAFGEEFEKFMVFPANPEDLAFATRFWQISSELIAAGKIKPAHAYVNRGGHKGLEGVLDGLQELKADKVSAGKLVYTF